MQEPYTVYLDVETSPLTLSEAMAEIQRIIEGHPDEEIFLDGDQYAIVGKPREGKA